MTKHAQFCKKTFDLSLIEILTNIIPYQLPYNSKWNETKSFNSLPLTQCNFGERLALVKTSK